MRTFFHFIAFCVLVFGILLPSSIYGATLGPPEGADEVNCDLVMEGAIVFGDSSALQAALQYTEWGDFTLCLDSPGGSLSEGIRMSEIIADRGVATLVKTGATCASACAVAFLGGRCTATGDAGIYENHCRFIEPGAVVGFHAPFIQELEEAKSQTFSPDEVRGVWATSRVSAGLYAEALAELGVPLALIIDFLAVDPNDLFEIDTLDAARRMNVIALGLPPGQVSPGMIIDNCSDVLKDGSIAAKQYAEGDQDFQIEVLPSRIDRQVIVASQLAFLNFPYATWIACRVTYENHGRGIFPSYAQQDGTLYIEKCDRIMLNIPESLEIPVPHYIWNDSGEIETLGDKFHEDNCEPVRKLFGPEAGMWIRSGALKVGRQH